MRSLEQWLAYQTQVHPQAIDLGLDRLQVVLERLHWRQPRIPVISVAGTNGKGSVSAYCTAILSAAGLKVGTFTSPHLRDYRERIRVHDRLVRTDELLTAFEKIEAARGSVALTFFEFNALAALLIFDAAALDAWVLEIGMGTDIRGGDDTKAAVRALRDALWHNSLSVANALGLDTDSMKVEVTIGTPHPDKVDRAQVLAVLPHGTDRVTV